MSNPNSAKITVEAAAQAALNAARNLFSINKLIVIFGLAGGILLIIFSFVPVCPPLEPSCWPSDTKMYNFQSLFPLGFGAILSVLWINAIVETVASRAALAAVIADQSK